MHALDGPKKADKRDLEIQISSKIISAAAEALSISGALV
jgi:hypothetical protein